MVACCTVCESSKVGRRINTRGTCQRRTNRKVLTFDHPRMANPPLKLHKTFSFEEMNQKRTLILFDLTFLAARSHGAIFFLDRLRHRCLRLAVRARGVARALL
jgi:hypothetical protein